MRGGGIVIVAGVVMLCAASQVIADEKPQEMPDLKTARRLEIDYGGKGRRFAVEKPQELQALLKTIDVMRTGPEQYGGAAHLKVVFVFDGGQKLSTQFMTRPDQLDVSYGGQIYLRDRKFYDRLCALISQREGRKVDPLKDAGLLDEPR